MRLRIALAALAVSAVLGACHSETENIPLSSQKIYFTDKFFDVKALSADRAIIVGYAGKMLETKDGGKTFELLDGGTDLALFKVAAAGDQLWVSGQEGLILHSADGGKTWEKQKSGSTVYLFSIFFLNENHGFAVGDRSTLAETTDGGKTWTSRTVSTGEENTSEFALAMQNPIFYDVRFSDEQTGWITGEFGQLLRSTDGGKTWTAHQKTLMTPGSGITDPMDIPTFFGEFAVSDQEALAAGLDGRVAGTHDGGVTWSFQPMKLEVPVEDPLYQPYVTTDGNGWVVGAAGAVLRRAPGQTDWTRADLGTAVYTWLRSISFADPQHGWMVGGFGTILRTEDGGKSWRICLG